MKIADIAKVRKQEDCIEIVLEGAAVSRLRGLVQGCTTGSCGTCDPEFLARVEGMEVAVDQPVIRVTGAVTTSEVARAVGRCTQEV